VLPEAIPSRWDVSEDYRYRVVDEGLGGLVEFVDSHRWQVLLRAKAPARRINLYPVPASQGDGELRVTCFQVELDASVLDKKGAGERLPEAFEQVGAVIEPFYGEARLIRGVAKHEGSPLRFHPSVELYPFEWNGWWGLPVRAPLAAMLGPVYREHWQDFSTSEEVAELAVQNRRPWGRDMEPMVWSVPAGLCQVYDPHWAETEGGLSGLFGGSSGLNPGMPPGLASTSFKLVTPEVRPPVWPFAGGFPDRSPDPLSLLSASQGSTGDGQIRQVAADDPDGEPFEAWERVMPARSGVLSVWVTKTSYPDWPWKLTVAALEFVRSEPLEGRLRGSLKTALEEVPGVTSVTEEDREILLIGGAPTGLALTKAATEAIDSMAAAIQKHYDHLRSPGA
jgi:hypothetical protein